MANQQETVPSHEVTPQTEDPSSEIDRLSTEFATAEQDLNQAQAILTYARERQLGNVVQLVSEAAKIVEARIRNGESIDEIIQKSQANVDSLTVEALTKELPLRREAARALRAEVRTTLTPQEIVEFTQTRGKVEVLDDPRVMEFEHLAAQTGFEELKEQAEKEIALRQRTESILAVAKKLRELGNRKGDIQGERTAVIGIMEADADQVLGEVDANMREAYRIIKERLHAGQNLGQIMGRAEVNILSYAEADQKREQLAQLEGRVREISGKLQEIQSAKKESQGHQDESRIATILQSIRNLRNPN